MRKPTVGEMRVCGCCGGDCQPITEEDLKLWDDETYSPAYDPSIDRYLGYDGCEEPGEGR